MTQLEIPMPLVELSASMKFKTREDILEAFDGDIHHYFHRWWKRGDSVAAYLNVGFGSRDFGRLVAMSFGSPDAQIETTLPPDKMPDTGLISAAWAYLLVGAVS